MNQPAPFDNSRIRFDGKDAFGLETDSFVGEQLVREGKHVPSEIPKLLTEMFRIAALRHGIHEGDLPRLKVEFVAPKPYLEERRKFEINVSVNDGNKVVGYVAGAEKIGDKLDDEFGMDKSMFVIDDGYKIIISGNNLQQIVDVLLEGFIKRAAPDMGFELNVEKIREEHLAKVREQQQKSQGSWANAENERDAARTADDGAALGSA